MPRILASDSRQRKKNRHDFRRQFRHETLIEAHAGTAVATLFRGGIRDAKTIVGLLWAERISGKM